VQCEIRKNLAEDTVQQLKALGLIKSRWVTQLERKVSERPVSEKFWGQAVEKAVVYEWEGHR